MSGIDTNALRWIEQRDFVEDAGLWKLQMHVVVVVQREANLLHVILALRAASGLTRLLHGRQQQADQNRDDRNHNQQFNEREATLPSG